MKPWIPYDCPEDACKALQNVTGVRERLGKTSARPWNMHEPRSTFWWLIPHDDAGSWPAYHLGKIVFEFGDEADSLDVALYVERGVTQQAADVLEYGDGLVTTNDWMWPRFAEDVRSGRVLEVARKIASATQLDVYMAFRLGPQVSPGAVRPEADVAYFSAKERPLKAALAPASSTRLRAFRAVTNCAELASALDKVDGYTWIDAYVGATFACTSRARTVDVWAAERIWSDLLAPLVPWIG